MKYLHYCVAIFTLLLSCFKLTAQTGWQWALSSQNTTATTEIIGNSAVDSDGNVYVAMRTVLADSVTLGPFTLMNPSFIVAKIDPGGHYTWATSVDAAASSLVLDHNGGLYIFGWYGTPTCTIGTTTLSNPTGGYMHFIAKYSPSGTPVWANNVCAGADMTSMGIDYWGNVYVAGRFGAPSMVIGPDTLVNHDIAGTSDIYYVKFDTAGHVLWAKSVGGPGEDYNIGGLLHAGHGIAVTREGDFYLYGTCKSDSLTIGATTIYPLMPPFGKKISYIARFASNGTNIWVKNLPPTVNIVSMTADAWGNCYTTGYIESTTTLDTFTLPWVGSFDAMTAKFNRLGNCVWARSAGGTGGEQGWGITTDHCGNVFVAGGFAPMSSINISGHVHTSGTFDNDPFFLVEYDSLGNYKMSTALPSGGEDMIALSVDNRGSLYVGADYVVNPPADKMILGRDTLDYNYSDNEYCLIAKYWYEEVVCPDVKPPVLAVSSSNQPEEISLYPNPVTQTLHISSATIISSIVITDPFGKIVLSESCNKKEIEVNTAHLASGIYLAKINGVIIRKFVKQ